MARGEGMMLRSLQRIKLFLFTVKPGYCSLITAMRKKHIYMLYKRRQEVKQEEEETEKVREEEELAGHAVQACEQAAREGSFNRKLYTRWLSDRLRLSH